MTKRTRRNHSPAFQAKVALAGVKGDKTLAELAQLLALAMLYRGGTSSGAAQVGGVSMQTVRDWVLRFNADGPEGLIDTLPLGGVALLDDAQRQALAQVVESGPIPASHGVVRWRLIDLAQWV